MRAQHMACAYLGALICWQSLLGPGGGSKHHWCLFAPASDPRVSGRSAICYGFRSIVLQRALAALPSMAVAAAVWCGGSKGRPGVPMPMTLAAKGGHRQGGVI
jgi:hypothetical protein